MFDVESYIARYAPDSETRLQRLLCIAQHAPSQSVALHAYRLLEAQLKDAGNDVMYQQVFDPNNNTSSNNGGEEEKEDIVGMSASMEYDMESSAPVGGMIVPSDAGEFPRALLTHLRTILRILPEHLILIFPYIYIYSYTSFLCLTPVTLS